MLAEFAPRLIAPETTMLLSASNIARDRGAIPSFGDHVHELNDIPADDLRCLKSR